MKIFLSWSGDKSRKMAVAFSEWIPCVIQAIDPWISTKDIDRGSVWFNEIIEELKNINFGVVFVTKENQDTPWLLFESGALSKGLTDSRICTILVDLNVRDIDSGSPLSQINHTLIEKNSILELVKTIHKHLDDEHGTIKEKTLEMTFNAMWDQLNKKFTEILESEPVSEEPDREDEDVLNDILENVISINRKVSRVSHRLPKKYIEKSRAETLLKKMVLMGLDRVDINEIIEGSIPENWLSNHLDKYIASAEQGELEELL